MISIWDIFWIVFVLGLIITMIVVAMSEKASRKKVASKLAANMSGGPNSTDPQEASSAVDNFGTASADDFDPNSFK